MTFLQNRGIVRYVSAADSQQERSVFYIGKKRGKVEEVIITNYENNRDFDK